MIFRNYFFINLLLLILVGFLGVRAFHAVKVPVDVPLEAGSSEVKPEIVPIAPKIGFPGESVFQVVSDKNIFSPARVLPVKKTDNVLEQSAPKEVPKLFGTMIIGSSKSAMLKDPETNSTKRYFVNDTIGDLVIKEIHEEGVVLSRGDEIIELRLREDKDAAKTLTNTTNKPVTTIPTRTIKERKVIPKPTIKEETSAPVEETEEDPNVVQ